VASISLGDCNFEKGVICNYQNPKYQYSRFRPVWINWNRIQGDLKSISPNVDPVTRPKADHTLGNSDGKMPHSLKLLNDYLSYSASNPFSWTSFYSSRSFVTAEASVLDVIPDIFGFLRANRLHLSFGRPLTLAPSSAHPKLTYGCRFALSVCPQKRHPVSLVILATAYCFESTKMPSFLMWSIVNRLLL